VRKPFVQSRVLTLGELGMIQQKPELADQVGRPIPPHHPNLQFARQASLGLATTQPKKFLEMTMPLSVRTENVRIVNAIEWMRWWLSADEVSQSYLGNAYEKAQSLMERIYTHIGYEKFMTAMKERGLSHENFALIVNDTGSSMEVNYSNTPEFARSLHEVTPGNWPGVETGPILDAQGGVAAFHSSLKALKKRLKAEGGDLQHAGWDEVTYLLFKPMPRMEDIEILSFEARVPLVFHTHPGRNSGDVLNSHDFLSVDHSDMPAELRSKRIADFREEYFKRYSPMALAMGHMIDSMEVPAKLESSFTRNTQKPRALVVTTQANIIPAQNGAHKQDLTQRPVYQTTQYDQTETGVIDNFAHRADAVVLTPHNQAVLDNWDDHFLDLMDLWCSLVVSKQVNVEQLYGKPLIVLDNNKKFSHKEAFNGELDWDDPSVEKAFVNFLGKIDPGKDPWLKFSMLTKFLHEKNFVKQEPDFLFRQISPTAKDIGEQIQTLIEEGLAERIPVPKYEAETYGADRTDMFEISVLGSAGTRVEAYIRSAEDLGYWCASQGMHVRTGGGNYGIMGAVSRGVLRFMGEHSHLPNASHLSAIQMPRTLQFEGACVDPKDIMQQNNKFMAVERDFDERMTSIFRSNICIAMAPGIGSYQEIVRWLRNKRDGAPHLQGQKLILVNSPQPGREGQIRLMDPLIKLLPKHVLENDITIVPSTRHARALITQAHAVYKAMHSGPRLPAATPTPAP
jgi:predicted Rossmann-fold nucleotide-binding protein